MRKRLLAIIIIVVVTPAILASPRSARPVAVFQLQPHPGGTYMMTLRATVRGHEGSFVLTGQRLDMQRCDELDFNISGRQFRAPIAGVFDLMKFMPPNLPKVDGSI